MPTGRRKTALVLAGSGARAAYEAGVLKAVAEQLPEAAGNPFPIVCGTSAGALNAVLLAVSAEDFAAGVAGLERFWGDMRCGDIYRPHGATGGWFARIIGGSKGIPDALFDVEPLRRKIEATVDFPGIERAIAAHALLAVSVTCSGLASGENVSFFQGRADLEPWRAEWRAGAHVELSVDHLLAAISMPMLFPAVRLHREHFGNGLLRHPAVLSPAIQLGAERVLTIAAEPSGNMPERGGDADDPAAGRILGQMLAGTLFDNSAVDTLCPLPVLTIRPSRRLEEIAAEHAAGWPAEFSQRVAGSDARAGVDGIVASLLLFEPAYTKALLALGYEDAMAQGAEVITFLGGEG